MAESENQQWRVLFLLPELFTRKYGMERFNYDLLTAAAQSLHKLRGRVLILNDRRLPVSAPSLEGIEVIPCAFSSSRILWKLKFAALALYYSFSFKPHLVFCGHINFLPLCLLLKHLCGVEYVAMVYGIEAWKIEGRWSRRALVEARKTLSISLYTLQRLLQQFPLERHRVGVLPCTVDAERFAPRPKSAELMQRYKLNGHRLLLTVGRLTLADSYKGYEVVLRALPRVLSQHPDVKYMIVGSGEYADHLKSRARELGVEDKVVFTGFVSDSELVDHYNLCDIFLMPSKGEGFGVVFLEALACGKPVVAGNRDGSSDALLGGRLGLLVNPDSPDAVADAIMELLEGNNRNQLTDPAFLRRETIENFGFPRFCARVKEILESVQ